MRTVINIVAINRLNGVGFMLFLIDDGNIDIFQNVHLIITTDISKRLVYMCQFNPQSFSQIPV